ncbi:hypothetical protein DXG01_014635, partial [Tephrocybe rancida]
TKQDRKKIQALFFLKVLSNWAIAGTDELNLYANATLREVYEEPEDAPPRSAKELHSLRKELTQLRGAIKTLTKRFARNFDSRFPPQSGESAAGGSPPLSRLKTMEGKTGTDFLHIINEQGIKQWFGHPTLYELLELFLHDPRAYLTKDSIARLDAKGHKSIIALHAVILAHRVRHHLGGTDVPDKFDAESHAKEYSDLFKKMVDIEDGKEGDEAKSDFEVYKQRVFTI